MRTENPWRAHLLPLLLSLAAALGANLQKLSTAAPVTLPGCPDKCGEASIPYPFGTKDGCFLPGFQIICNHTFDPPRAFFAAYDLTNPGSGYNPQIGTVYMDYFNDGTPSGFIEASSSPIELTGVSVGEGKLQVHAPFSYDCKLNETYHSAREVTVHFRRHSPFLLSEESTVLMAIGRSIEAQQDIGPACQAFSGLGSFSPPVNGTCAGRGCCQAAISPQLFDHRRGEQSEPAPLRRRLLLRHAGGQGLVQLHVLGPRRRRVPAAERRRRCARRGRLRRREPLLPAARPAGVCVQQQQQHVRPSAFLRRPRVLLQVFGRVPRQSIHTNRLPRH